MNSGALYNEIEPYAVEWLVNLERAGLIAPGRICNGDIRNIRPADLHGFSQAHFFAGIGIWSHALRAAGWPDELPVWTGSCPCQPFSNAGPQAGFEDDRHLWPVWFELIRECRPPVIFGEQVASPLGMEWLDLICSNLESCGYSVGAANLPAASVGAPHIRQRLYFVAIAAESRRESRGWAGRARDAWVGEEEFGRLRVARALADYDGPGRVQLGRAGLSGDREAPRGHDAHGRGADGARALADTDGWPQGRVRKGADSRKSKSRDAGELGDAHHDDPRQHGGELSRDEGEHGGGPAQGGDRPRDAGPARPGPTGGFWSPCDWVACTDGKARPVEPGTFPLVDGDPARVAKLGAYGNAIVGPLAKEFIQAVMEIL